jgi:Flp pilus assembly protein TadD
MSAGLERAKQHFLEGVRCFEAARFEEAEAQFRQSLALLPGRVSTLTNLAATCIELRRPQEALELLAQALAAAPDDADAWSLRGAALRAWSATARRCRPGTSCCDASPGMPPPGSSAHAPCRR